jgi:hypothetical protein
MPSTDEVYGIYGQAVYTCQDETARRVRSGLGSGFGQRTATV